MAATGVPASAVTLVRQVWLGLALFHFCLHPPVGGTLDRDFTTCVSNWHLSNAHNKGVSKCYDWNGCKTSCLSICFLKCFLTLKCVLIIWLVVIIMLWIFTVIAFCCSDCGFYAVVSECCFKIFRPNSFTVMVFIFVTVFYIFIIGNNLDYSLYITRHNNNNKNKI